jgi:hypothetical protein
MADKRSCEIVLDDICRRRRMIKREPVDHEEDEAVDHEENEGGTTTIIARHKLNQKNNNAVRTHHSSSVPIPDTRLIGNSQTVINGQKRKFLHGDLTIHNVLPDESNARNRVVNCTSKKIGLVFDRTRAVYAHSHLASRSNATVFYGLVPARAFEFNHLKQPNTSPAAHSLHNSTFSFQATSETARNVLNNPYSRVSFATQNTAKKIGVNLDEIIASCTNREHKTALRSLRPAVAVAPAVAAVAAAAADSVPVPSCSLVDKATQTGNTGSFHFEISCDKLANMTKKQKDLILQVMQVCRRLYF